MTNPATSPDTWEAYAVQYARSIRPVSDFYMGADPHDGSEPIFYYVWVLRRGEEVILVDTGFNAARAAARKRELIRCPIEALAALGIAPGDVDTVVITHLHYDHAGNMDKLPNARFVLQDEEMRFAIGRHMRHDLMRVPFELSDVQLMVALNYGGRVDFVDGDAELTDGVRLHHVPGHSLGLQAVTVRTRAGWLCLASDAAHFYGNIDRGRPFPIVADVARTLDGHDRVTRLAGDRSRLIPGHDPAVAERYDPLPADPMIFDLTRPKAPAA
ncbi:N-acyl homoserine lactonase family protein [Pseudooceanicola onchidii]|uniref:N-acyl homoserine lactonase family protein n=1 Tax=Pseudooceanicola onchidii TaxID=2562279 RepID=UPI0010AB0089|nr:N-acyl homoserine lactonase family protein [Pseudooceanicola onchidii]